MYKNILVPLDGSPVSESVLPQVVAMAKQYNAKVSLLRAAKARTILGIDMNVQAEIKVVDEATTYIEGMAEQLREQGIEIAEASVWYGDPGWAILQHTERCEVDLIIMGSNGKTGLMGLLRKGVAEEVLEKSKVPVLVNGLGDARAAHYPITPASRTLPGRA